MDLNQLQAERNEWVAHNFPVEGIEESIFGAVEEIGELAHHYLKRKQDIRGNSQFHTVELLDAVADCVIFLAGVCSHEGVEFGTLLENTWNTVKERDWVKYPENGRTA